MEAWRTLIRDIAQRHGLDAKLVEALVRVESGGNPWAERYEPAFYAHYIAPLNRAGLPGFVPNGVPTLDTEKQARARSYGLVQIMGNTARLNGFKGLYLSELFDPATNLDYGCRYLARCMTRAQGNDEKALLFYNGGGDPSYPARVFATMKQFVLH